MANTTAYTYLVQLIELTGSVFTAKVIFGFSLIQFFSVILIMGFVIKIMLGGGNK